MGAILFMNLDVIILAGGKGTRLASIVFDRPKPLALIQGKPFLDLLIEKLQKMSIIHRIILAIGYKAEQIKERYKEKKNIFFSEEKSPLGTGGAIKKALSLTTSNPLLLLNGDSYLSFDLSSFLVFHKEKDADMTLCTKEVEDTSRYGSVIVDHQYRISSFKEKAQGSGPGVINGGVYLIKSDLLNIFPSEQFLSLENDCLPKLLNKKIFSYPVAGYFIDIGTKESYLEAQKGIFL